jgi:hypothetical protein
VRAASSPTTPQLLLLMIRPAPPTLDEVPLADLPFCLGRSRRRFRSHWL